MRCSIRTKLLLAIGVPLLVAYLAMAWCEYQWGKREALANTEAHLAELAAWQAAELDGDLRVAQQLADTLAPLVAAAPQEDGRRLRELLQTQLRDNPEVYGMAIVFEPDPAAPSTAVFAPYYCRDGRGGLRYTDIAKATPDYARAPWYRPAKTGGRPFWTEPYFDAGVGEQMMCTYTVPLLAGGRFRGVLTVDLLTDDLLQDIARIKPGRGYCILVSGSGRLVSHPEAALVMHETVFGLAARGGQEELAAAGREMLAGKSGVRRIPAGRDHPAQWMVYAPVPAARWSLAAVLPEDEVTAPIRARLVRSLAILGVGLAAILGIVLLVSFRVTRPVARLAAAAEALGRGDLEARVSGVSGSDELGRLAVRFNAMVDELKANVEGRIREETARREVEAELKAAREIQSSLLPAALPPRLQQGFALHAVNAPAKVVAGDFFDYFFLAGGRTLAVAIADVSGKGLPAAMYMAVVRTRLRDLAASGRGPAEVVAALNAALAAENERNMFVTLFFGHYDIASGELTYVNAGHNPPYLVCGDGRLETLAPTGPLVAPFADATFRQAQCRLGPGDTLLLFTDGVTEAGLNRGELFGEARLEGLLESAPGDSAAALCGRILTAVGQFSGGDLSDDATVLALRRGGTCAATLAPPLGDVGMSHDGLRSGETIW